MAGTGAEDVREAVVRAAIPLLGEFDTLTTARIAGAARVDEAELLAVFADKEAVLRACVTAVTARVAAAMDVDGAVRELESVSVAQPLVARLVEVLGILDDYYRRVRADLGAFEREVITGTVEVPDGSLPSRQDLRVISDLVEVRQAVTRLLEPEAARLRLPAEALAEAFLSLSRVGSRTPAEDREPVPAAQVVDLFLHGALAQSGGDGVHSG
ncbi:AcrR family transcriptional regulator [Actinoplanes octamycinicus]|uniref:AcrR family transcriptional regulator n=1 Tax=Actinoplanes octamycinicus TaxID=135948 RepID=A0A7W7H321_9ACTN|nr:TetR/AcrR family transcriptional regulator [Actinoplanes octamycinicus]MBB4743091.1 AcrR family transcriptional regulator [Actinoplanes octamycinicus]GIE61347.1 TetR family transcriptional regulator [Actinoplanes octamycinicus]